MYHESSSRTLAILCSAICLMTACKDDESVDRDEVDMSAIEDMPDRDLDAGTLTPDMTREPVTAPSAQPRVKFKGPRRWGNDLSRALDLERDALCKELGEYDCLERVHLIALGGSEPYVLGIDEPLEIAPVTAPIAADRVGLSACGLRAERDLNDVSNAVIFKAQPLAEEANRRAASALLYRRVLAREGSAEELGHLVAFWDEVLEEVGQERAPQQWAMLGCYALVTSEESLFY